MTFDDILAQMRALLQREQRLSYCALQRRFPALAHPFNFWFLPSAAAILAKSMKTVKRPGHERENMPPIPTDNLDLLERAAVAQARQKREQYLRALDEFLSSFGTASEAVSIDEIRAMFAQYEKPGMPTLSSEIEAMREER